MKKFNKKTALVAMLTVMSAGCAGLALSGCEGCNSVAGRINAPTELEEDLGTYVIPDYEVVDENGMILAGYNVYLKSVKNADGEEFAENYGAAITVNDAGVYSFIYSAGSNKIADITVSIDFADRTAPTVNCDDSSIPKFYIKGNAYKIPQYTLSGDFDRSKCWAKVFYIDADKKETEVSVVSNRFTVDKTSGSYAIRIHVEDAAGNANDYEYVRSVDSPETFVENKVLYLDEKFGEKQISCYQSAYKGGFVSKADSNIAHGDEKGAYKVSFDGVTETNNNEGLLVMDVPAIIDINEYEEIYLYVYNDSGKQINIGSQWWNDTALPAGQWTRVTWNTRKWGNNMSANNAKPIGTVDISGMTIRFIFDYGFKVIPNGDFYLSAMYGTPKVKSEIETGENVMLAGSKFYINDTVELSAAPVDGKVVDYYKVDGEIIPGTNFIVTADSHTVEVVYRDAPLTEENMTWAQPEDFTVTGNDNQWQTMGISDYFAYTFDIYGAETGWCYAGAQVGGNGQLLGIEISDEKNSKFSGYGASWKWMNGVKLTLAQYEAIRGATQANPVKVALVRRGTEIRAYMQYGDNLDFIASVENSELGITENEYGYGKRNGPVDISHNIAIVGGETKTNLFFENFVATITPANDKVSVAGEKFYIGDKLTLQGAEPDDGKMLAYFTVNGERIQGNTFVVTKPEMRVEAIYTEACTIVLEGDIQLSDGRTGTVQVPKDTEITLEYVGNAPVGKVCAGFKYAADKFIKSSLVVTEDRYNFIVVFEDTKNEMLNDITGVADKNTGLKFDGLGDNGANKWAPKDIKYVTDFEYIGPDGTVSKEGVLKLKTQEGENSFALTNGKDDLSAYKEIYYYVYTEAAGVKAGGWWCNDTDLTPGKWTKVGFTRAFNPTDIMDNGKVSVWEGGLKNFAIRIFAAPADADVYVTAVYGVPYDDVTVTKNEASKSYIELSAPANGSAYKEGEKVTLTCTGAPAGKAFASFTVNGEDIEGAEYTLTSDGAEFGIRFADVSTITAGNGITVKGVKENSDGTFTVGKGVKVTLEYKGKPEGTKVFDYFTVDNERIISNTFVAENSAHEIAAVFADSVEDLTLVTSEEAEKTELTYKWSDYTFEGYYLDEAEQWAINATITELENFVEGKDQWYGFDFLVGTNASIQIRIHTSGLFIVHSMGTGHNDGADIGQYFIDKKFVVETCKKVSEEKPVSFTVVRDGKDFYVFFNGQLAAKVANFDFKAADNKFGIGTTATGWLPLYEITQFIYRTGKDITKYLTTANVTKNGQVALDKEAYKLGETATLSVTGEPPAGKLFAYFTANGKPIEGNTYLITEEVEFGVVFNGITNITAGSGVTVVDGKKNENGTISVGMDSTVTLLATVPAGKYLSHFTVDGKKIEGNTFKAENSAYEVAAVFTEKQQTGSTKLNSIADDEKVVYSKDETGKTRWNPQSVEYITDKKFEGNDAAVSEAGLIKITTNDGENDFGITSAEVEKIANFKEIYFYAYTEAAGVEAGGLWCNDTKLAPGVWTKVSFLKSAENKPKDIGETDNVWENNSINEFAYRIKAPAGVTVYVTEVYGIAFDEVEVTVKEADKEAMQISAPTGNGGKYFDTEIVTLTVKGEAPAGKAFAYFTANGEPIEGNTFEVKEDVEFGVVFNEISKIKLGNGIKADDKEADKDGFISVGRGASVTLKFEGTVPADKYFKGFAVDGEPIEGDTFKADKEELTVSAIFADRISSGNEQANNLSTGAAMHNNSKATLEYVTDVAYSGADGDVKDTGSLKITNAEGSEIAVKATVSDALAAEFKEVYFYIYTADSGVMAGTWWCNDTAAVAGEWTKVTIYKDANKNTNGGYDADGVTGKFFAAESKGSNFIFRIMGAADKTVYITSLYGVPYADVKVEVEQDVKDFINVAGTFKEGKEITVKVENVPQNKEFVKLIINGKEFTEREVTYTLGTENVKISAVFADAELKATLQLGEGVKTSDGKTQYVLGKEVTLVVDEATAPENKVFDRFEVDGKAVKDGKFKVEQTQTPYVVEAIFIDSAANMTWETVESYETIGNDAKAFKIGEGTDWVLSYELYGVNESWCYLGAYVGGSGGKDDAVLGFELSDEANSKFSGYGGTYKWMDGVKLSGSVYSSLRGATENAPVTAIYIRSGNTFKAYIKNGDNIYFVGSVTAAQLELNSNGFGIGERNANGLKNATLKNIKFVTGAGKAGLFNKTLTANIRFEKASAEEETYLLGETVTLIADEAEAGKKFLRFTVNDAPITGNTFVVTSNLEYVVVAEYDEISTIELGDGVKTSDGEREYARGATVTLTVDSATAPAGQVLDYFTVGGNKIFGNKLVLSEATYTVGAVFVPSVSGMTWTNGGNEYNYENVMGTAAAEWKAKNLDGEVYGSSEYWAISVDVKHTTEWNSFEFILGSKQSVRIRFHSDNYIGIVLMVDGDETVPQGYGEFTVAYPHQNAQLVAKLVSGATITCVRSGDTLRMYADGYLFFTTNYAFDHTGEWFGVGHIDAAAATKPEMNNTKFIVLKEKVEAYIESLAALPEATQKSVYQINNIYGATAKDNSATQYITEGIPEGLQDASIKENGVLKVTAASNDVGITPGWTFDCSPDRYSELYFYVYMASDEELVNVGAGAYWKDKTELEANKWVKVVIDSEMMAGLDDGANTDLSKITLRIYSKVWIAGFTAIQNKTFYITSLYGVPKNVEPIVDEGVTGYSLVSDGNGELAAIINNNFFPDAE